MKFDQIYKITEALKPTANEGMALVHAVHQLEKIRRSTLSQSEINVLVSLAAAIKVENLSNNARRNQDV